MKNYTQEEIEKLQEKANKWDALAKEIEGEYGTTVNGEFIEHDEENEDHDLATIGEIAAQAFGWLN